MHKSSMLRMKYFVDKYCSVSQPTRLDVVDVGSYDICGTYKEYFSSDKFNYRGLDICQGPNVDIVPSSIYCWDEVKSDSVDIIVSGQALEHIEFFWLTVGEMARVLRVNGLMCIIAPRGFGRHRCPLDCYRFDADGLNAIAKYCNLQTLHISTNLAPSGSGAEWYSDDCADSMLIAKKPENWTSIFDYKNYVLHVPDLKMLATGFVEKSVDIKARKFGRFHNFLLYLYNKLNPHI